MDGKQNSTPHQLCDCDPEFQLGTAGSQDHQVDTDN